MRTVTEPAREVPVAGEYDVVVAGGGPGGVVAAVAAARNGARTLLLERAGYLGGMATSGLMTSFNGFRNEHPPNELQTVRGLGQEVVERLARYGGATGRTAHGDFRAQMQRGEMPYAVGFDAEVLKRVYLEMCQEAGVHLRLHTWVTSAHLPEGSGSVEEPRRVGGVFAESKSGREAFLGAITVDATADGDAAASAGVPFTVAPDDDGHRMRMTLMYRVAGVEPERFERPPGCVVVGSTAVLWGPSAHANGVDADSLTRAEVETRARLWEQLDALRQRPGFEKAQLVATAAHVGVRETRLFRGVYVVTEQDAVDGRRFADVVAISSNPVPGYYGKRYFFTHEGFDIPYRALVPLAADGLILAGRCIACEQVPFQSARSMAPLMAISQASGTAAALSARAGVTPRALSVKDLQHALLAQGAELRMGEG